MKKAILVEETIEGSPELLSVEYEFNEEGYPEVTEVRAGTVRVTHLLSPLNRVNIRKALQEEVPTADDLDRMMINYTNGLIEGSQIEKRLGVTG